jgi:sterol desaturase/sphingolipid hydroxylase (fatty acid hydroxylase superfamily)
MPAIFWTPVIVYLFWVAATQSFLSVGEWILWAVVGFVVWTFTEYLLHRYIFHFNATSRPGKYLVYLFHGIHHDQPMDATRLVMPPVAGIIIALPIFTIVHLALGARVSPVFMGFFLIGYLCYDYIHFYLHHGMPKNKIGRALKQHHMLHHYAKRGAKWGVSSQLWDVILGTMQEPPLKTAENNKS